MVDFASLFAFKAWANEELLRALSEVEAEPHADTLQSAIRTVNHTHVVDRIFQAHLQGVPHGLDGTNTVDTPGLAQLRGSMQTVDQWYVRYARELSAAQLAQPVTFTFTDGDAGRMTRAEILMHVITHGGYHRGQAGQVLRSAGKAPPRELYTRFLHSTQPSRRDRG